MSNYPYELIIRGGTLVAETGIQIGDLGIIGGRIVTIAPEIREYAPVELIATGYHVFPGLIDAHVHFNEPGRAEWEGFATGTRALAMGGITTFVDMPLNAHPPTVDAAAFDAKLAAAQCTSMVYFAFWGGLVPGNLDRLDELAARGVIGFKAFMANSGIEDFDAVDVVRRQERVGRAVGQDFVRLHIDLAGTRSGAIVHTAVARGALPAGVDADDAPGDVIVGRGRVLGAEEDAVDVQRAVGIRIVAAAWTAAIDDRGLLRVGPARPLQRPLQQRLQLPDRRVAVLDAALDLHDPAGILDELGDAVGSLHGAAHTPPPPATWPKGCQGR